MSRTPTPAQRRGRDELQQTIARVAAQLQQAIGPHLTAAGAQALLEQADCCSPKAARELDNHLADNPTAFTLQHNHFPVSLARLLRATHAAGHVDAVILLGCADCGRTDRDLRRNTAIGRCCSCCAARQTRPRCARCGQDGRIQTRTDDGPICRNCHNKDAAAFRTCALCGNHRLPAARREDGTVLCRRCAPGANRQCSCCGKMRPAMANTSDGPVCGTCYRPPASLCGVCGKIAPIHSRANGDHPDTCRNCYRNKGECVLCGRVRPGGRLGRGGAFHCGTCRPRRNARCADCGITRFINATWPVGALCDTCYLRRSRCPQPCAECATARVLVGRNDRGDDICGPCSGRTDLDWSCRKCGYPGFIYADGMCAHCVASDSVKELLSDSNGSISSQLQPLADALAAAHPTSVLSWLHTRPSGKLLTDLAEARTEITHDCIDALPQGNGTNHLRELLVSTGILPRRNEPLAQLKLWLDRTVADLPPHQQITVRPFAEWQVLRDARWRATRGRYTAGAAHADRTDIRAAINFMNWLDAENLMLGVVTQEDLDRWIDEHPTQRTQLNLYLSWTAKRHLTAMFTLPKDCRGLPSLFLEENEHRQQLRRCLSDEALPLEVRIIGALIRIYGLPVARIVELTTEPISSCR